MVLVIVDLQEGFRGRIDQFDAIARRAAFAARAARLFNVPIVVTEQYPQGLGRTASELGGVQPIVKSTFSAVREPEFEAAIARHNPTHVVVLGIETHICVLQTSLDLLRSGIGVHILTDVTGSQRDADRCAAVRRLEVQGAVMSTVETMVFELAQTAEHEAFPALLAEVKAELRADA